MDVAEARDRLRAALVAWPAVAPEVDSFLASLPWRRRQVVLFCLAQGHSRGDAATALGVSPSTAARDLRGAVGAWARWVERRRAGP